MFRFIFGLIVLGLLAGFALRPSEEAMAEGVQSNLRALIVSEDLDNLEGLTAAALMACRIDPSSCANMLMAGARTTYEDKRLYARMTAVGGDHKMTCYGAFAQVVCPGGLRKR